MQDYYKDLQLPPLSPLSEVKKAYRKLAMLYHPDKNLANNSNIQNFLRIKKAYEFLVNTEQKQKYDNLLIRYNRKNKIEHAPILVKEYLRKVTKQRKNYIYSQKIMIKKNQCEKCEGYGQILNRFTSPSICPVCRGSGRKLQ